MKQVILSLFLGLSVLGVTLWGMKAPAAASNSVTTFVVNSTEDVVNANPGNGICETEAGNGVCTLRAAIQEANVSPSDIVMINLPSGVYTITLTEGGVDLSGDFRIYQDIILNGVGAETTVIEANQISRAFFITPTVTFNISGVTIQGGVQSFGGAIFNRGHLNVDNSIITQNMSSGQPNSGGGIYNTGNMTVTNSLIAYNTSMDNGGGVFTQGPATFLNTEFRNNQANNSGGGIRHVLSSELNIIGSSFLGNMAQNGAGIGSAADAPLTIINSTLSGNEAFTHGGAIHNTSGVVTINNTTITNNMADSNDNGAGNGGGIFATSGTIHIANTILAQNNDSGNEAPDCGTDSGIIVSSGYNLVGKMDGCNWTVAVGDLLGTIVNPLNPQLDLLTGWPAHFPLLDTSPAIDAGNPDAVGSGFPACATVDQAGTARPVDGTGDGTAVCDIGAIEYLPESTDLFLFLPILVKQ